MPEVFEHEDEIVVTLEMPPAAADAVRVSLEMGLLLVTSEGDQPYRREVVLPCAVDADRMDVACEGGVLRITLLKAR
jgi:HSP20 family molecular chaperone IbpA